MNDSFLTQAFAIGRKLATTHLKSFFDHYYRVTKAEKNYNLRNRPADDMIFFFFQNRILKIDLTITNTTSLCRQWL